ncbi:MAG: outer membrane beta-barrel protein [Flavobacteriales bacterium]|nr:outer membrane beta-barrel protein [Flavobacteriales bacterium]
MVHLCMRLFTIVVLLLSYLTSFGQDEKFPQTITAGAEFRPIFPAAFLNTGEQSVSNNSFSVNLAPKFGFSAGMTVRYGFHKRFALETGINYIQRSYNLSIKRDSVAPFGVNPASPAFNSKTDFTIIGYEHPIKLLFFVQLAEKFYMNAAGGLQLTFFPSDIFTTNEESNTNGQYFRHYSTRLGFDGKPGNDGFIHGGGILNLGMEYRTEKAGYFYLGGTYHVPFANIYRSRFEYTDENNPTPASEQVQQIYLNGSYLTFDIRYFFTSQNIVRKEKKKRNRKTKKNKSEEQ